MAQGDITKRDEILWNYTFKECLPYLKYQSEIRNFRRSFFGPSEEEKDKNLKDKYCAACRKAGKAKDCEKCSREIGTINGR